MKRQKSAEVLRAKAKDLQSKAKALLREADELERAEALRLVEALRRAGKLDEVRKIAFSDVKFSEDDLRDL